MFPSHDRAGGMTQAEGNRLTSYFDDFSVWSTLGTDQRITPGGYLQTFGTEQPNTSLRRRYVIQSFKVSAPAVDYTLEIRDNGTVRFRGTANGTNTFTVNEILGDTQSHYLDFTIVSDSVFTPTAQQIVIKEQYWNSLNQWADYSPITYNCTSGS